jgi:hypothetical protein
VELDTVKVTVLAAWMSVLVTVMVARVVMVVVGAAAWPAMRAAKRERMRRERVENMERMVTVRSQLPEEAVKARRQRQRATAEQDEGLDERRRQQRPVCMATMDPILLVLEGSAVGRAGEDDGGLVCWLGAVFVVRDGGIWTAVDARSERGWPGASSEKTRFQKSVVEHCSRWLCAATREWTNRSVCSKRGGVEDATETGEHEGNM